ncbi:ABC transporter substrate-binding protein [Desulfolutivibrio sulfodismutans]|uniref:ABC transporter substrate-binding protein n=1 Tax=Desulfolutivibrio sulfodismutans TaxID=63561 RepID=UPI001BA73852|nr:ABC transporter substrate-binding protein [Desulfolutivibrio sulfodismutans]
MLRLVSVLTLGLTLALAAAVPAKAENAATPVPIGLAVAQTSNAALFGLEQMDGAKIAQARHNAAMGANGTKITLIFRDTAGDEAGAVNAFRTLLETDKVVAIVGPTLSQQAFAADPLADQAKTPVVAPSNTAAGIPDIGPFVSRVSAPMSQVAPHSVRQALRLNPAISRVAVLFAHNDAYCASETATFQEAVKNMGLTTVAVKKFQTTDTDFTAQIAAVLEARADLAIISGLAADAGALVRQLRQKGYAGLIVGGNGLNSTNIFPVCGAQCDGILVAQAYSPDAVAANPANQGFVRDFQAAYHKTPGQFSAQAYTAVQVIAEAVARVEKESGKKAGEFELSALRQAVNAALRSGPFLTPLGEIRILPSGEVEQKDVFVSRIAMNPDGRTGSFVLVAE